MGVGGWVGGRVGCDEMAAGMEWGMVKQYGKGTAWKFVHVAFLDETVKVYICCVLTELILLVDAGKVSPPV